jgi:hypothetical protein
MDKNNIFICIVIFILEINYLNLNKIYNILKF